MNQEELKKLTHKVVKLSIEIGSFMKDERSRFSLSEVESKSYNNLVSYVDKESEDRFVKALKDLLPNCGILGEEGSSVESINGYTWIIDPLDGTTNFVHGIPAYCTSTALENENKEIILGVVYEPNLNECFYTWKDAPSYLNNKIIEVSESSELDKSLLATGFPYDDFGKMDGYMNILKSFMKSTRGIRRIGSAALDLCYTACGRIDGFYEYALQPWDVAAGSLIVKNAGGQITDFDNGNQFIKDKTIIASNSNIHNAIQQEINKHF